MSGVGLPYEKMVSNLRMRGGETQCFAIDFPSRAMIYKLLIAQYDGAPVNITAALYNDESACGGDSLSASQADDPLNSAEQGPLPPDLFRVTPDFVGAAPGKLLYFADESNGGRGYVFFSPDKTSSPARLGNARRIYLQITASGSGPVAFAVSLGGLTLT